MSRAKTVEINKQNVKAITAGKNMTLKEVAEAIGMNYTYLCKAINNGKISMKKRSMIAAVLECSPSDLSSEQTELIVKRRGRWVYDADNEALVCDRCGCVMWIKGVAEGAFYFCTNCGADMRAEA